MTTVREVMTENVRFVEVTATIRQVVQAMYENDARHIPVLEDGELSGIVSDRDLRELEMTMLGDEGVVAKMRRHMDRPVTSIMHSDVLTVGPEDDLGDAIDLMLEHKIGAVPVVGEETQDLIGIVSYVDVLRAVRPSV